MMADWTDSWRKRMRLQPPARQATPTAGFATTASIPAAPPRAVVGSVHIELIRRFPKAILEEFVTPTCQEGRGFAATPDHQATPIAMAKGIGRTIMQTRGTTWKPGLSGHGSRPSESPSGQMFGAATIEPAFRIEQIHRVVATVPEQIRIVTGKGNRIFARPPPSLRIVIPRAEADQAGVRVRDPPGKSERLEARVGVLDDHAVLVVVDALGDRAGACVNHEAHAPELVGHVAVGNAALDHGVGDVGLCPVDEAGGHVAAAVQLGDGVELVAVDEALHGGAVAFLPIRLFLASIT